MVKKSDQEKDRSGKEAVVAIDTQQQVESSPDTKKTISIWMCIGLALHWYDVFTDM